MRVLIAHNQYSQLGGEDIVVRAEKQLPENNSNSVKLWLVDNKDLPTGLSGKVRTAIECSYSKTRKKEADKKIREFNPDIVHVHNFFPQLSPSIYDSCEDAGIPVVQTLHNYRLICPGAMLVRDGIICKKCVAGSPYQAALYGCYRKSRLGTFAVARMISTNHKKKIWLNKVSAYITLTEFSKELFITGGLPANKLFVKPNFANDPFINSEFSRNKIFDRRTSKSALFVGRISSEKGVKTMVSAWRKLEGKYRLKVVGDGPLASMINGQPGVDVLGKQPSGEVSRLMSEAQILVMPSECYEGLPMVIIEAFSQGIPVLASRLGAMKELIVEGKTGMLFEAGNGNDLAEKASWMLEHKEECKRMGGNARQTYLEQYTPEKNYAHLMNIYSEVLQTNSGIRSIQCG